MKSRWERAPLEEAVFLQEGPGIRKYEYQKGGYPIINVRGVQDGYIDLSTCVAANVELATGKWKHFQVNEGDILFTISGSIGRTARVKKEHLPLLMNTSVVRFRSKSAKLKDDFFYYYLQSWDFLSRLHAQASGTAQKNVGPTHLKTLDVPLPPLSEQQRIVAILDTAFDCIATAKANAEQNLQNARALFESHLQSVFTQRGEGWVEHRKPLADLCELIVDCEHKTAPTQEEGIPSIRTPNIGKGELLLDGVYRVSEETYCEWTRRAEPLPGDLILAREAPAGNVAVIPENLKVCLGQRTVLIRPRREVFEPAFLSWMLLQPQMQQKLLAHSRGATVQHVNMKDIRALDVGPIPSLPEQKRIVANVGKAFEETQRLESLYQRKLATLDELKKSLLHQAFTGQLIRDN